MKIKEAFKRAREMMAALGDTDIPPSQGVTFPRSKPPPIASITITCAVLSVDTQWTSGGPVIRQHCRVQEITSGGIIERVPCFGLGLNPYDAITITVSKSDA
jgi:hypothetical protein